MIKITLSSHCLALRLGLSDTLILIKAGCLLHGFGVEGQPECTSTCSVLPPCASSMCPGSVCKNALGFFSLKCPPGPGRLVECLINHGSLPADPPALSSSSAPCPDAPASLQSPHPFDSDIHHCTLPGCRSRGAWPGIQAPPTQVLAS